MTSESSPSREKLKALIRKTLPKLVRDKLKIWFQVRAFGFGRVSRGYCVLLFEKVVIPVLKHQQYCLPITLTGAQGAVQRRPRPPHRQANARRCRLRRPGCSCTSFVEKKKIVCFFCYGILCACVCCVKVYVCVYAYACDCMDVCM